jgi:hypothetical protein
MHTSPFDAGGGGRGEAAAGADGADGWALPGTRRRGSGKSRSLSNVAGDRQGAGPEQPPFSAHENRKAAEGGAGRSAQQLRRGLGVGIHSSVSETWQAL